MGHVAVAVNVNVNVNPIDHDSDGRRSPNYPTRRSYSLRRLTFDPIRSPRTSSKRSGTDSRIPPSVTGKRVVRSVCSRHWRRSPWVSPVVRTPWTEPSGAMSTESSACASRILRSRRSARSSGLDLARRSRRASRRGPRGTRLRRRFRRGGEGRRLDRSAVFRFPRAVSPVRRAEAHDRSTLLSANAHHGAMLYVGVAGQ